MALGAFLIDRELTRDDVQARLIAVFGDGFLQGSVLGANDSRARE
jgi:hypothetical protein